MTVAPWLTAYLMPAAIEAGMAAATDDRLSWGSSGGSVTGTDRIRASGATPIMPAPPPDPWPRPAIRLAIGVPCSPAY